MTADVAKRIWVANGGPEWASADSEGALLALETLVVRYVTEALVRASLALKYLSVLEDAVRHADYEDAAGLRAEAQWVEGFLDATVFAVDDRSSNPHTVQQPDSAASRWETLHRELAQLVLAELKAAEIAA